MDGRGGCCIARNGGGVYDMSSKVDRIMLRFRPIAPKPVAGGSVTSPEKADANLKTGRGKRRCSRDSNSSKRCNRKRKSSPEEKVVTLPLLPEKPDRRESPASGSPPLKKVAMEEAVDGPEWLSFDVNDSDNNNDNNKKKIKMGCGLGFGGVSDRTVVISPGVKVVGSCVVVECVTDTWVGVGTGAHVLGSTDEERKWSLERDTCPGFVSDGMGRVTWTNGAYRKMVVGGQQQGEEGNNGGFSSKDQVVMTVLLVMKEEEEERVRTITYPAFTCRVRLLQYTCGKERGSLTLPCDVWRLDGGGFAWRLDVKAALSLGR